MKTTHMAVASQITATKVASDYSIRQFQKDFPNDDTCIDYIFQKKFSSYTCSCGNTKFYRVKGRKAFACSCGKQINPITGTIFEKSSTPLTLWFYAIYLFSVSRNGVSGKELQRQLGITYKCAWRIANQIRTLMAGNSDMLGGIVEVDETYIGGKGKPNADKFKTKSAIMGMIERDGKVKANLIPNRETHIVLNQIVKNVKIGSKIMSDEYSAYKKLPKFGYQQSGIKHGKKHYVKGDIYTNTIEGFWGQLKNSIRGTYHAVSPKHLQTYVDEFSFRYNHRDAVFSSLVAKI